VEEWSKGWPSGGARPLHCTCPMASEERQEEKETKLVTSGETQWVAPGETQWRRRRPRQSDTESDTRSVVSSQWQPDTADIEMINSTSLVEALPVNRMRLEGMGRGRRTKRMKVDLTTLSMGPPDGGSSSSTAGMFSEFNLLAPADEHTGNALLCFLSEETFVGFVELQSGQERHVLKLNGSESLTECDRALCSVQDCCGDKAFLVTAQSTTGRRKRTFLARSAGVGDYVAFEGRGMRFSTDFVPGDEQREQVLSRHFGMLPRSVRRDSVLCLGQMTLHWRGLGAKEAEDEIVAEASLVAAAKDEHEGYNGDKSDAASSGDEHELRNSVRGILPMLSGVAIPKPRGLTLTELVARGGKQIAPDGAGELMDGEDDWL